MTFEIFIVHLGYICWSVLAILQKECCEWDKGRTFYSSKSFLFFLIIILFIILLLLLIYHNLETLFDESSPDLIILFHIHISISILNASDFLHTSGFLFIVYKRPKLRNYTIQHDPLQNNKVFMSCEFLQQ